MSEFNLLDEKWIVASDRGFQSTEYSLMEIFREAHRLSALSGDSPAQDLAVLRLLLAILYSVYLDEKTCSSEENVVSEWKSLWTRGSFDNDRICDYLESFRDGFYLFDEVRPFYQANIPEGSEYSAAKLNGNISESGRKPRIFNQTPDVRRSGLTFGEAARWLLFVMGFDDTSCKPKGKGLPSSGAGWLGMIGPVYVCGSNLFETLLLNMVMLDGRGCPFRPGIPPWESDEHTCEERVPIPFPDSPVGILTLQSRRILLHRDGNMVTGYRLLAGDLVEPEGGFTEQMTAWHVLRDGRTMPLRHDPTRMSWGNLDSLLVTSGDDSHRPGVVKWVSYLLDRDIVDIRTIRVCSVGICYSFHNFSIEDQVFDCITFPGGLLTETSLPWVIRIQDALERTEECTRAYGVFCTDLAEIHGICHDKSRERGKAARSEVYWLLEPLFRRWVSSIDPEHDDMDSRIREWMETVRTTIIREENGIVGSLPLEMLQPRMGKSVFESDRVMKMKIGIAVRGD